MSTSTPAFPQPAAVIIVVLLVLGFAANYFDPDDGDAGTIGEECPAERDAVHPDLHRDRAGLHRLIIFMGSLLNGRIAQRTHR